MTFPDFMLNLRQTSGLSLAEAGRRGGVSHAAISTWELGTRQPTIQSAASVAEVYGARLGFYVDGRFYPVEAA